MKKFLLLSLLLLGFINANAGSAFPELIIYPNPNQGKFEISLDGNTKAREVSIYNVLGSKVFCGTLNDDKLKCDLSQFEPGLYLIKLELEGNEVLMKRFYIK